MARDLDRLLCVFSALLPPLIAGCGPQLGDPHLDGSTGEPGETGETGGETIDAALFDEDLCDEQGPRILAAVAPQLPVDFIERRVADNSGTEDAPQLSQPNTVESVGTRCGGAADPAACEAAYAGLPLVSDWFTYYEAQTFRSIAFTRGDEVGAIGTLADLLAFLGPLDTASDGALVATMEGHRLVCVAGNDAAQTGQGTLLHTRTGGGCGEGDDILEHVVLVRPDGSIEVVDTVLISLGDPSCSVGRLPAGLHRARITRSRREHPVGSFFAEVAHLEAAAVAAFDQLARELAVHGAPRPLIASALRSRHDEARHARQTAALARRHGGCPVAPRVEPTAPRSLVEVAADNAAEGCIRETYGALVAHRQARCASDPVVRRTLAGIARDETRHAALSWALARWARQRMSPAQRRLVDRRAAQALQRFEVELTAELDDAVHVTAGLPRPDEARRMFHGLRDALRPALAS